MTREEMLNSIKQKMQERNCEEWFINRKMEEFKRYDDVYIKCFYDLWNLNLSRNV